MIKRHPTSYAFVVSTALLQLATCTPTNQRHPQIPFRTAILRNQPRDLPPTRPSPPRSVPPANTYRTLLATRCKAQLDQIIAGDKDRAPFTFFSLVLNRPVYPQLVDTLASRSDPTATIQLADLIFFRTPTLVMAVVVDIDDKKDQIEFAYVMAARVRRGVMSKTNIPINTYLRPKRLDDPPGTRYLASELFVGRIDAMDLK